MKQFRKNAVTGLIGSPPTAFSEDPNNEGMYFTFTDPESYENKDVWLSNDQILAVAVAGVLGELIDTDEIASEVDEMTTAGEARERAIEKVRKAYNASRQMFDFEEDYYTVEGWGIQKLDGGDFRVV